MSTLTPLFRTFLEVSLSSAVVIGLLLALRPLLRRRYAPRRAYWAWLIVAAYAPPAGTPAGGPGGWMPHCATSSPT